MFGFDGEIVMLPLMISGAVCWMDGAVIVMFAFGGDCHDLKHDIVLRRRSASCFLHFASFPSSNCMYVLSLPVNTDEPGNRQLGSTRVWGGCCCGRWCGDWSNVFHLEVVWTNVSNTKAKVKQRTNHIDSHRVFTTVRKKNGGDQKLRVFITFF